MEKKKEEKEVLHVFKNTETGESVEARDYQHALELFKNKEGK